MNVVVISGRVLKVEQKPYKDTGNTNIVVLNKRKVRDGYREAEIKIDLFGLHEIPVGIEVVVEGYMEEIRYQKDGQEKSFTIIKGRNFEMSNPPELAPLTADSRIPF
jgi:hypothetical protein